MVSAVRAGVNPSENSFNQTSLWDISSSFFFAGTVITTIGKWFFHSPLVTTLSWPLKFFNGSIAIAFKLQRLFKKKHIFCFSNQQVLYYPSLCFFLSFTNLSETTRNAVDHFGIKLWQITLANQQRTKRKTASDEICFPRIRIGGQTHFLNFACISTHSFTNTWLGKCTHNNTLEKELRIFQLASMNPNVFSAKILVSCLFVLRGRCLVASFDSRSSVYIVPN